MYDEAEDLFAGESIFKRSPANESKAWMNRMFERNPVPTLWISNCIHTLDPAFSRRFDFVFEVGLPPPAQRLHTLKKICGGNVSPPLIQKLSRIEKLTPAGPTPGGHGRSRK